MSSTSEMDLQLATSPTENSMLSRNAASSSSVVLGCPKWHQTTALIHHDTLGFVNQLCFDCFKWYVPLGIPGEDVIGKGVGFVIGIFPEGLVLSWDCPNPLK